MTAAALTILLMGRDHVNTDTQPKVDKALERGMQWMDENYQVHRNPGGSRPHYYHVAVQHVGLLAARRQFNGHDWYEAAAEHMVKTQRPDGTWPGDLSETAFAVIFLARGGLHYDSGAVPPAHEAASENTASAEEPAASHDETLFGDQ